jgi:hypothetical protein
LAVGETKWGRFTVAPLTLTLGWATTAIMALAAIAKLLF